MAHMRRHKGGGQDGPKETRKKVRRLLASPCDRPPASPTGVVMSFTATEARTHLNFRGKIKWNDVTTDTSGLRINNVDRWDIQWRATDSGGTPVEPAEAVDQAALKSAVNNVGSTFLYVTRNAHHFEVGMQVTIKGCQPQSQYNGTFTIAQVPDNTSFKVAGGASGVADCRRPGEVFHDNPVRIHRAHIKDPVAKANLSAAVNVGAVNEVQHVALTGFSGTDSFRLRWDGNNSSLIVRGTNYNAGHIKNRIESIAGFTGTVDVTHVRDNGFDVEFTGAYASTSIDDTLFHILDEVGCSGTITTTTQGSEGGTTFRYTTHGEHGFHVGEHVRITGCKPQLEYNGTFVVTGISGGNAFTVNGGTSGIADCEEPGKVFDADDSLHITVHNVPRPKTWYWQSRVRARSGEGCWSRWSEWTDPELPWLGADPRPPYPDFDDPGAITFDKKHRGRESKIRLLFTFEEVIDWDVPGGDRESDVAKYDIQLDKSDDGITWDGRPYRHTVVNAKDADSVDDDDVAPDRTVHFFGIRRRFWYRCRVRTIDRFGRKGDWSPWTSGALPFDDDRPPAPGNVSLKAAHDRIVVDWDPPTLLVDTRGTVSVTAASAVVTGVNTKFTVEVEAGTRVSIGGVEKLIKKVTSDTSMTARTVYAGSQSAVRLKLVEEDPDAPWFRCQLGRASEVDAGPTPDEWDDVYAERTVRHSHAEFRIPDDDEEINFYARVRSIDAALNKSRWVAARDTPNSDPDASGTVASIIRDRVVVTFRVAGELDNGNYDDQKWRSDRHYRIKRITGVVGRHDPATHPIDGTPHGQPIQFNLRRILADDSVEAAIVDTDDIIEIPPLQHKGVAAAATSDFNVTELFDDDVVYLRINQVGDVTRHGRNLAVDMVLIPIP